MMPPAADAGVTAWQTKSETKDVLVGAHSPVVPPTQGICVPEATVVCVPSGSVIFSVPAENAQKLAPEPLINVARKQTVSHSETFSTVLIAVTLSARTAWNTMLIAGAVQFGGSW